MNRITKEEMLRRRRVRMKNAEYYLKLWLGDINLLPDDENEVDLVDWHWNQDDNEKLKELLSLMLEIYYKTHGDQLMNQIAAFVVATDSNMLTKIIRWFSEDDFKVTKY